MDLWQYRFIIVSASIPTLLVMFYLGLRLQRWKFSEEVHMSKFDLMFIKAKYFIFSGFLFSVVTYIITFKG